MNNNKLQQKNRNYGIDLLRIVSMFMVVILHILNKGGILDSTENQLLKSNIAWLLEAAAFCAVNCYAIISGYVMLNSKFKFSNILNLYCTVIFYTIGTTLLFDIFTDQTIGIKTYIKSLFPFAYTTYWYFTSYFCMFLFTPFLNHTIHTTTKKQATMLVVSLMIVFSVLPTVFEEDFAITNHGYSALWLSVMYILGAYIKKYNIGKSTGKLKSILCYFCCIVLTWLSKIVIERLLTPAIGEIIRPDYLYQYVSPLMVLSAVSLLLFFSGLNISKIPQKLITFFSPLAFSVYLIHEEPLIVDEFIRNRFSDFGNLNVVFMVLAVLATTFIIWLSCSLIDYIRLNIFKFLKVKELCLLIESKVSVIFNNWVH